ncbi:T9SS type A sorting domain-containing protein [Psychroserpens jangbogonensis]|uniref:T9SS type A sorting domain-containing protein n=1 Tax=Psychroserpens jangbogonensis TaxID=1484460 RepID=UPI00053DCF20|nr:T9SS type A sorting domain-containing protein [Psychroserpens jangbogonensis]
MKKLYFLCLTLLVATMSYGQEAVVTGYMDSPCPSQAARTVEIYVDGTIDFTGWNLVRQSNGGGFTANIDISTLGTLTNEFAYITNSAATLDAEFGINTNVFEDSNVNANGDDGWQLTDAGDTVIDRFGVDGEDATGFDWEHLDSYAYRVDGVPANGGAFVVTDFTYGALNLLDGEGLCNASTALSNFVPFGTYSPMANTNPTISITSPNDGQALASGTTSVNVEFTIANAPGATANISVITNGGAPVASNGVVSPFEITPTADGDTFSVSIDLIDGGIVDTDTADFSIAYPCDLQLGTITETCDDITPAADDTYNVTIDFTGGGTSTYAIDTAGNGTLGGDDPTTEAAGTITVTGILEGTDFTMTFVGDMGNSSCDLSRSINSPNCDPQLTLPLYDTFAYADGPLVGNSEWSSHSGTADDLVVTSGQALVQHGTPSEDVNLPFTSVTGSLYFAFDMLVQDPGAPITGSDTEYFAHFKTEGFDFIAQVFIEAPTGGGDYTVGISSDQNSADATWAADLTYGNSYRITVKYDQVTAIATLWVDAALESDTSIIGADEADPGDTVASFALRQSDSDENEGILVDNLAVTQTFAETLSNEEFTIASGFKVYPNPTSLGFVNIASAKNDTISVAVYDILGKEVINETLNNNRLDVSTLNTGVYIMKVTQNNASVTKKLIIK